MKRYAFRLFVAIILVLSGSQANVFGPQITFPYADTLIAGQSTASVSIAITDSSGIVSYTLYYNGKDCTSKVKETNGSPDRRLVHLFYTAPVTHDMNTLIVNATTTDNRQSTRYLAIKKEKRISPPDWLRKALFHLLKRLK